MDNSIAISLLLVYFVNVAFCVFAYVAFPHAHVVLAFGLLPSCQIILGRFHLRNNTLRFLLQLIRICNVPLLLCILSLIYYYCYSFLYFVIFLCNFVILILSFV